MACLVTSSSPVPPRTRRVGQRWTLNLSRAETSSRWCDVERGCQLGERGFQLRCRPRLNSATLIFKIQQGPSPKAKSPRVVEQCD
ncbi:hypothetical protein TNCV_133171 [Trichonephila clavipes]|nr:hypothetical protein TNCV_133171 [Trichonephila clavipes]